MNYSYFGLIPITVFLMTCLFSNKVAKFLKKEKWELAIKLISLFLMMITAIILVKYWRG